MYFVVLYLFMYFSLKNNTLHTPAYTVLVAGNISKFLKPSLEKNLCSYFTLRDFFFFRIYVFYIQVFRDKPSINQYSMLGLSSLNDHSQYSALTFWTAPVLSSGHHNNLSNPTQQTQSKSCVHFGCRRSFSFSAKLCISFQIFYYSLTGRLIKPYFPLLPFISTIHFRGKSEGPPSIQQLMEIP